MSSNARVYYAIQQVAFKKHLTAETSGVLPVGCSGVNDGTCVTSSSYYDNPATSGVANLWEVPRGIQSVGITTNYNLEQVGQLGQLEDYENIETLPDVELTTERLLDGTMPLYLIASDESGADDSLVTRNSSYRVDIALNIHPDGGSYASGVNFRSAVYCSGMYLSSISYTFPVDGNATESLTFVGNDKFWNSTQGGTIPDGNFPSGVHMAVEDPTSNVGNLSGVVRRENFNIADSTLPNTIPGVSGGSWSSTTGESLQTVTISVDLGREDIFRLGQKAPFYKYPTFPVDVTCAIETITREGDLIEADSSTNNLSNETIIIRTWSGLVLNLGTTNKLTSVEYGGGDTGGGNVTTTYNYINRNSLTITHTDYPH